MVTHHHHLSELSRCFSSSALGMVFQPLHSLLWPWPCVCFPCRSIPPPQRLYYHQWLPCLIELPFLFPHFSQALLLLSVYFAAPWATWAWLGRATSWQDSKESSRSAGPARPTAQTFGHYQGMFPACSLREQGYSSVPSSSRPQMVSLCLVAPVLYLKRGCWSAGKRKLLAFGRSWAGK